MDVKSLGGKPPTIPIARIRTVSQARVLGGIIDCRMFMASPTPLSRHKAEFIKARKLLFEKMPDMSKGFKGSLITACNMMEKFLDTTTEGEFVFQKYRLAIGLAEVGANHQTIVASILSELPASDLAGKFSGKIVLIVNQLKKISSIHYDERNIERREAFLSYLISEFSMDALLIMAMDEFVTLQSVVEGKKAEDIIHTPEVRRELALKAFDVTTKFLRRINHKQLAEKLEDLALHYLDPKKFELILDKIRRHIKRDYFTALKEVEAQAADITRFLSSRGMKILYPSPFARVKTIASTDGKMERHGFSELDKTFDIEAMRFFVPTIKDCYLAAEHIRNYFKERGWVEVEERKRDYILNPKGDTLYRSYHMTFMHVERKTYVEVQVRTPRMHIEAEFDGYKDRIIFQNGLGNPPSPRLIYDHWKQSLRGAAYTFDENGMIHELLPFPIEKRPTLVDLAAATQEQPRLIQFKAYVLESESWVEVDPFSAVESGRKYNIVTLGDNERAADWTIKARENAATLKAQVKLCRNPEDYKLRGFNLINNMIYEAEKESLIDIAEIMKSETVLQHVMFNHLGGVAQSIGLNGDKELYTAIGLFAGKDSKLTGDVARKISGIILIVGEAKTAADKFRFWVIMSNNQEMQLQTIKMLRKSSLNPSRINIRKLQSGKYYVEIESSIEYFENYKKFLDQAKRIQESVRFIDQEYSEDEFEIVLQAADAESMLNALEMIAVFGAKINTVRTLDSREIFQVSLQIQKGRNRKKFMQKLRKLNDIELI